MASDSVSPGPAGNYQFRPVTEADLPMLRRWLGAEHVRQWWGEQDHELEMVTDLMAADWAEVFIVEADGQPIAYLQAYDAANAGPDWPSQPTGTWGLNTLIGPTEAMGRGHGSAYLRAFGDWFLSRPGVVRLSADPSPENRASIRAFEKAGFVADCTVTTPDGPALMMIRSR